MTLPQTISGSSDANSTSELYENLENCFPGRVSYPATTTYESSVASYFYQTARQRPGCFVSPKTAQKVADVVRIIAACPQAKFAIRSGGHSPHPEMSNTDSGVTIDLRELDSIELSQDNVLRVGAGSQWRRVYDYLDAINRTAVGSRESLVGPIWW
ncbi:hypothetical protein K491DRAFT_722963 [Lophiostoma macrostomum CBS 122681]|uniref:FAD-binding PCMH-type domain-containing protein n=1 Tax=Lophiostoma macrostomum CBS 122681 TaxID=1314788 RepID=A0A6A6SN01_9PLEO|nr:hypothetical protein K491DRAFT_722963 [Lophiostoma macrostomum CBS 122681]